MARKPAWVDWAGGLLAATTAIVGLRWVLSHFGASSAALNVAILAALGTAIGSAFLPHALARAMDVLADRRWAGRNAHWNRIAAEVASKLDFSWERTKIGGVLDGVRVVVVVKRPGRTAIRASGAFGGLLLQCEPATAVRTGDPTFDARFRSSDRRALGFLHADARRALRAAREVMPDLAIAGDTIFSSRDSLPASSADLEGAIRALVACIVELRSSASAPAERFAILARQDPHPGVRLVALTALGDLHLGPTDAVYADAIADRDPAVRLLAARRLRSPRWDLVAAIAADPSVPEPTRVEAIEATEVLVRATRIPLLEAAAAASPTPALLSAIGDAAAAIGDPECEALLLQALPAADPDAKRRVIEALAHVGSARAVEPLRAEHGALAPQAERAITAIQARLRGADAGQLALAEEPGGAVSLATGAGEVSLAAPKRTLPGKTGATR